MNIIYILITINFFLFLYNIYLVYKNKNKILNYVNNTLSTFVENDKNFLELKGKILDINEHIIQQKSDIETELETFIDNKLFSIVNDVKILNKKINSDEFNDLLYTNNLKQQVIKNILESDEIKQNIINEVKNNYIDTYFELYNNTFTTLYKNIMEEIKEDISLSKHIMNDGLNIDYIDPKTKLNNMEKIPDLLLEPEHEEHINIIEQPQEDPLIDKQFNNIVENMKVNKPAITQSSEGLNMNFKSKGDIM